MAEDELIKKTLETSKTIAMVGVSSIKKEEMKEDLWVITKLSQT